MADRQKSSRNGGFLTTVALLVLVVCSSSVATTTGIAMAPTLTPAAVTAALTLAPAPAAVTPPLTNDMRALLRKIGSVACPEAVRSRMFALLFEKNRKLHDQCTSDSGYQFFPYTGVLPDSTQIVATVTSIACGQIHTGAILAAFPECDIDFVSVRSAAETFLRIKQDIDQQRTPPTQAQFYELYNLNRVVNLLSENATLVEQALTAGGATVSLSEMTRLMRPVVLLAGVTLAEDMTVLVDGKPTSDLVVDDTNNNAATASSSSVSGSDDNEDDDDAATYLPATVGPSHSSSQNDEVLVVTPTPPSPTSSASHCSCVVSVVLVLVVAWPIVLG